MGLYSISVGCPLIEVLYLYGCENITCEGLMRLSECCSELREINIAYCLFVEERGVESLLLRCHKLEELALRPSSRISVEAINQLKERFPKVLIDENSNGETPVDSSDSEEED